MSAPVPTPAPAPSWRKRVNVGTVVLSTVLGALVGYLSNVWIMAVRSDGYNVKAGSAAAAPGNLLQGSLFWLLAPTIVFAFVGYWRAIGTKRLFFEMRRLPRLLLLLGKSSGRGFQVQFLVGALVGVLASLWIGPTLGLVASLGFMAMLPTAASSILSSFGYKITQFISSKLARPSAAVKPEGAGLMTTVVAMFGGATALLLGFFVTSTTAKWVIAVALAVLIVLRSGWLRNRPAALFLMLLAGAALALWLVGEPARADDGGWIECYGQSWWDCPGSDTVRSWGIWGALLGGVGAGVGGALGGVIGGWPPGSVLDDPEFLSPGDPANDLDPADADAWIRDALDAPEFSEWAGTHAPSSPLTPEDFDDYMGWRHDQGLDDPPLPEGESPRVEPEGPPADEPSGVTTTEVVEGPTDKFEGSEGWSGEPGGEGDEFDEFLDDLFGPEEEDVIPDDLLDDLLGPEEEAPGGEDVLGPEEGETEGDTESDTESDTEDETEEDETEEDETEEDETEGEEDETEGEEGEEGDTSRYRSAEEAARAELARERAEAAAARERAAGAEPPNLDGDPRFDDSMHEIDPDARSVNPETGEPLVDPRTGEPLKVDADGNVKYGDEWVDPETAAQRTALDATHIAEVQHGRDLVDEFKDLRGELDRTTEPAARAALEAELRAKAAEINGDYQAKIALKNEGRTTDVAAFDQTLHQVYGEVDGRCTDAMTERGIKIGGRDFTPEDMKEFRNPSSAGTASIDRDFGLDESKVADLESRLAQAEPGSAEAKRLSGELIEARRAQQVTVDYDKLLDATRQQLDAAEPGSARAQELADRLGRYEADAARNKQTYVDDLRQRLDNAPPGSRQAQALQAEIDAAAGRAAGRAETPVSKNTWNDYATDGYRDSYTDVTGRDPQGAFQTVTQRGNVEAYGDPNVLRGDPKNQPFDPGRAEQTASVTGHKVNDMNHLADEGKISGATAAQEAARGTAKDANTKLFPTLENDPRVDPGKYQTLRDINDVLTRAGTGEIPPGQIDSELRKVVPGDPDMNLNKAVDIIQSNLEAATKFQPEVPRESGYNRAFSAASDLAAFDANRQALIDKGMDPVEATAVAAAQTHAGNLAQASGVADPRMSMAAGALLPRGVDNVLPDRAIENYVGTGYEAGRAAVQSLNDSIASGRIDTTALDKFGESVANRPGADPFKGYAELSQLAGAESARTDGGNLVSDMRQIIQTGAGAEVANQSMAEFQADVAAGKHGPALEGLDHVMRIASELGVDPKGTVGEFVEDLRTIYNNGVGEGYWSDAANHTVDVLHNTPVVGHVIKGYEEIGGVVGNAYEEIRQQGVVEYGKGVGRDVADVAGYVYDETTTSLSNGAGYVANAASNFGSWVKSCF